MTMIGKKNVYMDIILLPETFIIVLLLYVGKQRHTQGSNILSGDLKNS